ncbi:MAG: hypothetical protein AAB661_00110 [Patescibacteria group bacterium]
MDNKKIFFVVIGLLILGTIAAVLLQSNSTPLGPGKYDAFAACLKDKGAVFYGAFWCAHCQSQKKLFGSSQKLLPYVECSLPSGQGQTQGCTDKKIEGYPTWEFADGSRLNGEIQLEKLAEKTACVLPDLSVPQ